MSITSDINRIQGAKSDIRAAIQAKGVTVPSNALIDTYATYISQIQTGGGGESVPELPNILMVYAQKTSIDNTPSYTGRYVKQNVPSDWTDTYYVKPGSPGDLYSDPSVAYYLCCAASENEYMWFFTTYSPDGQENDPIDGMVNLSVISGSPVSPQAVRWENDTIDGEQVIIIVTGVNNENITLSGTYAVNNNLSGTYAPTTTLVNGMPSYYNSSNGKYLFVIEDGTSHGTYAWTIATQTSASTGQSGISSCHVHSITFTDKEENEYPSQLDWYEEN